MCVRACVRTCVVHVYACMCMRACVCVRVHVSEYRMCVIELALDGRQEVNWLYLRGVDDLLAIEAHSRACVRFACVREC